MTTSTAIAADLKAKGFAIVDDFYGAEELAGLVTAFDARLDAGKFRAGGVGSGKATLADEIRRDQICWLDASDPEVGWLFEKFANVRRDLNPLLFLGLRDEELHFSNYEAGAFYRRHRDRFCDSDRRTLSFVSYLNRTWSKEWGGQLVVHFKGAPVEVIPTPNRAVFFLSDEIEHEVLATTHPRRSLTGWFRRGL